MQTPILYSFRRCPYAMRARMALAYAQIKVELREVVLSKKPSCLIALSPKATVPVLQVAKNTVIDESLDIMQWALNKNDPQNWLKANNKSKQLITENDQNFKTHLDHYKYADRFPEFSAHHYRQQGEQFLKTLETQLSQQTFLSGQQASYADVAIFPFIRQFASVDREWFEQSQYTNLKLWLNYWLRSDWFSIIMKKYPAWQQGDKPIYIFA